jgi:hypothetical protein
MQDRLGDPIVGFAGMSGAGKGSQTRWIAFGVPTPRREVVSLFTLRYDLIGVGTNNDSIVLHQERGSGLYDSP